ncbi:hypothetical protein D3C75_1201150 [compost metagenome]
MEQKKLWTEYTSQFDGSCPLNGQYIRRTTQWDYLYKPDTSEPLVHFDQQAPLVSRN